MKKVFKKSKKTESGAILRIFGTKFGENEFFRKKGLCNFLNIPIIYH